MRWFAKPAKLTEKSVHKLVPVTSVKLEGITHGDFHGFFSGRRFTEPLGGNSIVNFAHSTKLPSGGELLVTLVHAPAEKPASKGLKAKPEVGAIITIRGKGNDSVSYRLGSHKASGFTTKQQMRGPETPLSPEVEAEIHAFLRGWFPRSHTFPTQNPDIPTKTAPELRRFREQAGWAIQKWIHGKS